MLLFEILELSTYLVSAPIIFQKDYICSGSSIPFPHLVCNNAHLITFSKTWNQSKENIKIVYKDIACTMVHGKQNPYISSLVLFRSWLICFIWTELKLWNLSRSVWFRHWFLVAFYCFSAVESELEWQLEGNCLYFPVLSQVFVMIAVDFKNA